MQKSRIPLATVTVFFAVMACNNEEQPMPDTPLKPRAPAPLSEAQRAANIIKTVWPIAQAASKADWSVAECQDTAKTFASMQGCVRDAAQVTSLQTRLLANQEAPSEGCGGEIFAATKKYLSGQERYLAALDAWLSANERKLTPTLQSKPLTEACRPSKCKGLPYSSEYEGAGFQTINNVECTKVVFRCGPADNVCWINKVADRLGVGDAPAPRDLTARSTGVTIL